MCLSAVSYISFVPDNDQLGCKREPTMGMFVTRFLANELGATAIEYGLIAAGIAIVIIAAVQAVGSGLYGTFRQAAAAVTP